MKKEVKSLFAIITIIFVLVGCSSNSNAQKTEEKKPKTKTITDITGKKVEVPLKITRIADS
ncbi:hypothetical protein [Clostridium sp.]|uniref:hypothetical protein n=1 Tax=Clostridium sp. TaxID=1506 RepID=UPI00338D3C4C